MLHVELLSMPSDSHQNHTLRPGPSSGLSEDFCVEWMKSMTDAFAVLDAIIFVIHPKQWHAGLKTIRRIKAESANVAGVQAWSTVFNAIHIIANRATPYHRDTNAPGGFFDLLGTFGAYGKTGVMSFRNLGFTVPYDSGSVCALCTNFVVHGVPEVDGDRLCFSLLMEDNVHHHYGVDRPGWSFVHSG